MILEGKSINCETALDMMFDYIDGTLSSEDASLLERHIGECEACKKELDERRELLTLVKQSRYNPPAELKNAVMEKVENTPNKAKILSARRHFLPWAGTVAAACAAVVVLIAGRNQPSNDMLYNAEQDNAEVIHYSYDDETVNENVAGGVLDASNGAKTVFDAENEDDGKVYYVETTIGALTALTPSFYDDSCKDLVAAPSQTLAEPTEKSELDVFYTKIQARDVPVILVESDYVNDAYLTDEPEILIIDGQTFLRYTVTSEAEPIFDALVNDFETNNVTYKAAFPENASQSNTVELLVLAEAEN